ncbi:hypothetical protein RI129_008121 [Pyrocoelia pectoralis]|uniref:Peptidase S1 domain-containing protein n=1 Tax=Pyrocoelia pectoralis TaxID=417401 RepID=A0AAN7VEU3_9COLE
MLVILLLVTEAALGNLVVEDGAKLLDSTSCGYQNVENGTSGTVSIYEFPWLVHVKLSKQEYDYEFADRCNGALINDRYVLTNAYCGAEAIKVIIGQYRTNESVSCNLDSQCTDPRLEINVEENIRDGIIQNGPYDFSLLRLQKKVPFSDFIKPICLDLDGKNPQIRTPLTFSGWGASNSQGVAKKRLVYNVVVDDVCFEPEPYLRGNVKFAKANFICSTPPEGNKVRACNGEHGSPFMYKSEKNQWFVDGVVVQATSSDVGVATCAYDKPVNGIRITSRTIEWILATIRS